MTSQKDKFVKLWDLGAFSSKASLEKGPCQKLIPSRNIKDESLILPHINLSNF